MREINVDKYYWKELQNYEDQHDILAIVLLQLKALTDYADCINKMIPDCIARLEIGRKEIVKKTEKTFSDICSMLDEFNDGEESTYETAVRICEHYKKTKK